MILVVEDNAVQREATVSLLESKGYSVRKAATANEAIAAIRLAMPDVLVMDLLIPGNNADGVLREVDRNTAVIVATAMPDPLVELPSGVTVLRKPFHMEELVDAIQKVRPK